ncbi:hypothetical protein E2562_033428 [Oryza meyeriana var. granulata]|uniref:Uncharacterized protein n=1 Tax=Oryza meyeriana var. granulata TaxID=110450 RepID=A0A6G1E6R7_9ORYZ|nr:hypothetical protein E2562_033428 [Oryza meyeriana var. granulata]
MSVVQLNLASEVTRRRCSPVIDNKGRFFVKSSYRLYMWEKELQEGFEGSSGTTSTSFNWRRLWDAKLIY